MWTLTVSTARWRQPRVARLALDALFGSLPEDILTAATENALWDTPEQLYRSSSGDP
jgi:hypothetical protein